MAHPATEKRGGNPDVKHKPEQQKPKDAMERKLEQGLEESMTGSDRSVSLNRQRPSIKASTRTGQHRVYSNGRSRPHCYARDMTLPLRSRQ